MQLTSIFASGDKVKEGNVRLLALSLSPYATLMMRHALAFQTNSNICDHDTK